MSVTNISNAVEGEEAGESLLRDLKSTISELVLSPLMTTGNGVVPDCAYANRLLFTLENIVNHGYQYSTGFFKMITGGVSSPFDWLERLPDCLPGTQYLINTAKSSTQSPIARIRVFFRLALNDKTLHECIRALSWDQRWTGTHYKEWAIMRNPAQLTSLVTKLEPLSAIDFKLMTVELVVPLARADYWSVANLTLPHKADPADDESATIVVSKSDASAAAAAAGGRKKKKVRRKQQGTKKASHQKQQQHEQHEAANNAAAATAAAVASNPFAEDAIAEEMMGGDGGGGGGGGAEEEDAGEDTQKNEPAQPNVADVATNPFAEDAVEDEVAKADSATNPFAEESIQEEVEAEKKVEEEKKEAVKEKEEVVEEEEEEEKNESDDVTDQLEAFLNQEGISSDNISGNANSMASADDLEALLNEDDDGNVDYDEGDVSDDINDLEEQLKMLTSN